MGSKPKKKNEASSPPAGSRPTSRLTYYVAVTVVGVAVRMVMVLLSPRYGYFQDHDDLARWGLQATEEGTLTLYDRPPQPADLRVWKEADENSDAGWALGHREMNRLCNYPPLSAFLLSVSGQIFKLTSPDRTINTLYSRASIAIWSLVFDILLAWGCARLTVELVGAKAGKTAYRVALLLPPFWIVSSLWGQLDTWVLAPVVWMIWAMSTGRWAWAGVLYGVAAAIKPQAAAFIPVWGLAIFIARPAWRPIAALAIAAVSLNLIALPYWLHSGDAWWRQSYHANLFEHSKGMTTLMAFNIWYIDCLLTGSVDETAQWLGLSKATWGQIGLAASLLTGFAWTLRRWATDRGVYVMGSLLMLLAFIMIPTRVHERFIVLVLPFSLVAASASPSLRPAAAMLIIASILQVTGPQWLRAPSAEREFYMQNQRDEYAEKLAALPEAQRAHQPSLEEFLASAGDEYAKANSAIRPFEWGLTLLSLAGAAATVVGAVRTKPTPSAPA